MTRTIWRRGVLIAFLAVAGQSPCYAQSTEDLIKALEPGIGYSKFKQWAIENKLVFESFTKDQLTVRDFGVREGFSLRIFARFCGGDDYAGRGSSITIQQVYKDAAEALTALRDGAEILAGPPVEGRFPGQFNVRRDLPDNGPASAGIAILQESDKGSWELGLFAVRNDGKDAFLIQVIRRKEAICG